VLRKHKADIKLLSNRHYRKSMNGLSCTVWSHGNLRSNHLHTSWTRKQNSTSI